MNIIITGATKGIGRSVAFLFAEKGFSLGLCARTESDLLKMRDELNTQFPASDIFIYPADLSDKNAAIAFGKACLAHFSSIDILVNNAGIFIPGNIYNEPDGAFEQLITTNLFSAYYLTRTIIPAMTAARSGHIFNMCSVASINAYDAGGSYAISKFALLGFSKNLRHELKPFNIRVTAVLPGATLTESWKGTELPESRFIDVNDVAKLIWSAFDVSERTVVEEILIRPMEGDI